MFDKKSEDEVNVLQEKFGGMSKGQLHNIKEIIDGFVIEILRERRPDGRIDPKYVFSINIMCSLISINQELKRSENKCEDLSKIITMLSTLLSELLETPHIEYTGDVVAVYKKGDLIMKELMKEI